MRVTIESGYNQYRHVVAVVIRVFGYKTIHATLALMPAMSAGS